MFAIGCAMGIVGLITQSPLLMVASIIVCVIGIAAGEHGE
jgi:hypothetical protein